MATSFQLWASSEGPRVVLTLTGALDLAAVEVVFDAARQWLDDAAVDAVVADLSEVSFLDSSGIGALVRCWHHAEAVGKSFRVVNARGRIREVLALTNVLVLLR